MAVSDKKPMSRLMKLANKFNCFYLSGFHTGEYRAFVVDGQQVGLVRLDVMKEILNYPQMFNFEKDVKYANFALHRLLDDNMCLCHSIPSVAHSES
ncbi:uncharacterized protein LOC116845722 [Odontomachus brunneus]|uniref:uncharacterized protein LOC116845722 n=1 Tax=Odontomachus brunneus TaxID=486640 RepID=UPI0013F1F4BA|nr:uncharacterized protein LOC116845722 [Odontomachus brunneus]